MPAPSKSKKKFSDMVDMAPEVPILHWRLLTVVRLDRDGSGSSAGAGSAQKTRGPAPDVGAKWSQQKDRIKKTAPPSKPPVEPPAPAKQAASSLKAATADEATTRDGVPTPKASARPARSRDDDGRRCPHRKGHVVPHVLGAFALGYLARALLAKLLGAGAAKASNNSKNKLPAPKPWDHDYTPTDLYRARKRCVSMLDTISRSPPPSLSKDKRQTMQFAALRALQRLANGRGCYMLVSTGCVHGALTLMRRDPTDRTAVMMCMDIPRALLVNPLCAIRARKTKGFAELAEDVCAVVDAHHSTDAEVCAVAASALWPAATLGGEAEVKAIIDAGGLRFLRRAMKLKGRSPDQTRRLAGCIRALTGGRGFSPAALWDSIRRFAASGPGHAVAGAAVGAVAGAVVGVKCGGPKPGTRVNRFAAPPREWAAGELVADWRRVDDETWDVTPKALRVSVAGRDVFERKYGEEAGRKKRWVVATSGNYTFTRRARRGRD